MSMQRCNRLTSRFLRGDANAGANRSARARSCVSSPLAAGDRHDDDGIRIGPAGSSVLASRLRCHGAAPVQSAEFRPLLRPPSGSTTTLHHPPQTRGLAQHAPVRGPHPPRRGPDMRRCQSLEDLAEVAHDNLDDMHPKDVAAFWTLVPKHLHEALRSGRPMPVEVGHRLERILLHTLKHVGECDGRHFAQTTLGLAKVVDAIFGQGRRLRHQFLHDVFIGARSMRKRLILNELADATVPVLERYLDPRHLSNITYAFGLIKHDTKYKDGSSVFDILAWHAIPDLNQFNGQDLSNTLWAYANAGVPNSELFRSAGDNIAARGDLDSFWPQALSNIVWAYATLNEKHPQVFERVADHIISLHDLASFRPQELHNIVFAYATLGESHPMLFEKVADHIVRLDNLNRFNARDLSNIAWAYATAKEAHPRLFEKVADHISSLEDLTQFSPQNLSVTVWAYAAAGEAHDELFRKIGNRISKYQHLNYFNERNLVDILWAYATCGETQRKLFRKIADQITAMQNLDSFGSQDLANIVCAYATAKRSNPSLFDRVARAATGRQWEFDSRNIARLLWAYASNGHVDEGTFRSWESTAASHLGLCNRRELASIAWSYAAADAVSPELFGDNFIDACMEKKDNFTARALCQLHQWQLWQEESRSDIGLPPSLREKCREAFISQDVAEMELRSDVISELVAIGLSPDLGVLTESGYRLDALVDVDGDKVVGVEVDDKSRFADRTPTGSTILKRRQVANLDGIELVSIPYWKWKKLKQDRGKKQEALRVLLGLN